MTNPIDIKLIRSPIELYKILKFEALADSGGHAKQLITCGHVKVNDKIETRKRRKIIAGDHIECNGIQIRIME